MVLLHLREPCVLSRGGAQVPYLNGTETTRYSILLSADCLLPTAYCSLRCRHVGVADVEIGGNFLHIVVVFEGLH
jgi:hypothetical protein